MVASSRDTLASIAPRPDAVPTCGSMRANPLPRAAAVAALGLLAVLAPLALSALDPPILAASYGRRTLRLELFAAFA